MTYRSLLVALDATPANAARVDIAIALARAFEAHLVGIAPTAAIDVSALQVAAAMDEAVSRAGEALQAQAEALVGAFERRCAAAGLASFEAVAERASAADSLARNAQFADLLVMSQPDPAQPGYRQQLAELEQLLLGCARPVLLIPYTQLEPLRLRRALVAWDGGREAVRAMTDALPLLRRAEQAALVNWRRDAHGERPLQCLASLQHWLGRHGVRAHAQDEVTQLAVGDALLNTAADMGADLIVMGAYGHARWTERLFGGASRTLLETMTVPVLMAH